jgi:hypothetical protein
MPVQLEMERKAAQLSVISFMLKDNCVEQTSSATFLPEGASAVGCATIATDATSEITKRTRV